MTYDNGLTKDQQKEVDIKYEELMQKLKLINPKEYQLMQNHLKSINSKTYNEETVEILDNQLKLF